MKTWKMNEDGVMVLQGDKALGRCEVCGGIRYEGSEEHTSFCEHYRRLEERVEALEKRLAAVVGRLL